MVGGTGLQMPTGDHIVFSVERDHSRGPIEKERVEALNELRSHLARSAFVSARLGLQRAKGANDALTSMGLPALLLDESGTVVEANRLIEEMGEHVHWRARNRVALTDGRANELLWAAWRRSARIPDSAVRSFPLRDADDRASMVVHLIPVRRSAHDIFTGSYALLVLTPVAAPPAPPVELMRSLFDLTPSEARVAAASRSAKPWKRLPPPAGSPSPPCARNCARCWKRPDAPARLKWCRCWPTSRSSRSAVRLRPSMVWPTLWPRSARSRSHFRAHAEGEIQRLRLIARSVRGQRSAVP